MSKRAEEEQGSLLHREEENSEDSSNEYNMAVKKVELPSFNTVDPIGWNTIGETYFEFKISVKK